MKIIDDIISTLSEDSTVYEVYTCLFWTAVISKNCGLAATFTGGKSHEPGVVRGVGTLRGRSALELARYANSDNFTEATIGMATINSLINIDEGKCNEQNALDILAEKGQGKNIAIIGHFPWIPQLQKVAKNLWVLEQRPHEGDLPAEAAEEILPQADVVGITGTTFINHTLPRLLELSKNSFKVMVGPTSPLSPVLFDYGIDVISGIKVIDTQQTLRFISEAATFRQIQGIKLLSMVKEK